MTNTDKLKRLAEAATPGPWEASGSNITDWNQEECSFTMEFISNGGPEGQGWSNEDNDAAYIAAANPQAILALIAENEALKLEKELGQWPLYSVRKQRDEAVALLRELTPGSLEQVDCFLARIDGEVK